jgi:hypothetical protein
MAARHASLHRSDDRLVIPGRAPYRWRPRGAEVGSRGHDSERLREIEPLPPAPGAQIRVARTPSDAFALAVIAAPRSKDDIARRDWGRGALAT